MRKFTLLLLSGLLACSTANAQWNTTSKPVEFLSAEGQGDYYASDPVAARTADGKTWIAYKIWDSEQINDTTFSFKGVHTYVQLLDADGNKQFEDPGICLNPDYETPSWWSLYGMAVASDGSLLVGVSDSRSEILPDSITGGASGYSGGIISYSDYNSFQPSIYKIDQEGNFLWGLDGITFPDYQSAPFTQIYVNGDDVYFQFTQIQSDSVTNVTEGTYVERISPDGVPAWETPKRRYGQIIPSEGSDILVFDAGSDGARCTRYTRDLDLDNPVWETTYDENAYGGHDLIPYKVAADGEGGAAVAFVRNVGNFGHNIRVQHISSDGEATFGLSGIDVYNSDEGDHDYCGISVNQKNKEILVDWEDQLTTGYTVSIGKFNFDGDRPWGETGIQTDVKQSQSGYAWGRIGTGALADSTWIVAYRSLSGWAKESIIVKRVDANGNQIWKKTIGRNIDVNDPTLMVEPDCTYLIWREGKDGQAGIDGIRISNSDGAYTGIKSVMSDNKAPRSIVAIYGANGTQLSSMQNGLNIVKYSDGTVEKVIK